MYQYFAAKLHIPKLDKLARHSSLSMAEVHRSKLVKGLCGTSCSGTPTRRIGAALSGRTLGVGHIAPLGLFVRLVGASPNLREVMWSIRCRLESRAEARPTGSPHRAFVRHPADGP
jgi:hypothetical protein